MSRMFTNGPGDRGSIFSILEMVSFPNTINYLTTQMNNETSFENINERFIMVVSVKKSEWEKIPFGVAG